MPFKPPLKPVPLVPEYHITTTELEQFQQELEQLKTKRPQVLSELVRARNEGDRSENAAYKASKWELGGIDKKIRYLNKIIQYAQISKPSNNNHIQLGHTVHLKTPKNNTLIYKIVSPLTANPKNNSISLKSPLGKLLKGKQLSDKVQLQTSRSTKKFTITKITL